MTTRPRVPLGLSGLLNKPGWCAKRPAVVWGQGCRGAMVLIWMSSKKCYKPRGLNIILYSEMNYFLISLSVCSREGHGQN